MKKNWLIATALSAFIAFPALAETRVINGEELAADQTFIYRILDDFKTLDPQLNSDVSGSEVMRDLFEGLMNEKADGSLEPGVAESYTVSDDGKTYTFHLRDALWSDGKPVTAGDFVYAWQRLADPETASEYAWYMELMGIENASAVVKGEADPSELGVKAIDDKTFEVKLINPLPYFPAMTVHSSTFPSPQWAIEEHGQNWTKPGNMVSNGAYVLTEYAPGEKLVRERNVNYWNNEETILDKSVALIINDEAQALTRYLAGELHKTEVPTGQYPRLKEQYPDQATAVPYSCSYFYWLNMSDKGPEALKDVRVRKALSYAVNRDVIVDRIMQGGQTAAYNLTHTATANFTTPDIPFASWTQQERVAKAKELLAEAGYGPQNPLELKISYNTSEGHKKIAIAVSQFWKAIGVTAVLENTEWKVHTENMQDKNYEVARYAWCGDYNEASTYLDLLTSYSGHNNAGFNNADYDALMAESKTIADPSELYTQAEAILAEEMPFIPMYHYTNVNMFKPNLRGWPLENVMRTWYSRDLYLVKD
ncbi:peptide ABC transporter substrate-binding protein [Pseudovibrio sp. SPO723]|uniref:peptide ABC transporter substrate-binding protein n=1 Tax=Nesiotobacter zosterae TaxID=392721 RepID=UPI0029C39E3C|nr:peptide ABC transporter substrate-binding protein [Pseudovibrio sp. SPO723]MDX5594313.1 peptide ABC transporter substrate-binding protein [Pseudovibrio sp. SPO723]